MIVTAPESVATSGPAPAGPRHVPVLLAEVRALFAGAPAQAVVVDGTLGLGGHAEALLEAGGAAIETYIGMDRDGEALALARDRLARFDAPPGRLAFRHGSFIDLPEALAGAGRETADFILLDLGVSTYQLKTPGRGFALSLDGPLDMRMDASRGATARELLDRAPNPESIERWLSEYGEVRFARRIARALFAHRGQLRTTGDLSRAVLAAIPHPPRTPGEIHRATLVFQALRIAVNRELEALDTVLPLALDRLRPGGRLAVISFHSLEDRRVKQLFERESRECVCPPKLPACGCGHHARVRHVTRGAVQATADEVAANPSARSARLRAVERLP